MDGSKTAAREGRAAKAAKAGAKGAAEAGKPAPARRARRAAKPEAAAPEPVAAAPETAAPEPAAPQAAAPTGDEATLRRSDLLEAVAARSKLKRSDAKALIELVLEELGRALDRTEELALPPLGKLSVKKRKPDKKGTEVLTLRLRRTKTGGAQGGESPLADPGEDG
jgi:nucleoid DNA-binding protein